jgi:hypothetical protein
MSTLAAFQPYRGITSSMIDWLIDLNINQL